MLFVLFMRQAEICIVAAPETYSFAAMKNVFRGRRQRGFESFGRAPAPISLALLVPSTAAVLPVVTCG